MPGWESRGVYVLAGLGLLATAAPLPGAPPASQPVPVSFGANFKLGDTGSSFLADQVEPAIAVNPTNPLNLVSIFLDHFPHKNNRTCRIATTFDGGATWRLMGIMPGVASKDICADPSAAGDPGGAFYAGYLGVGSKGVSDLLVAKSADGGQSFPIVSVPFSGTTEITPDKPYVASDIQPLSPFRGALYVSWTQFGSLRQQINVQTSRDGGSTWAAPTPISEDTGTTAPPTDDVQGSVPLVAPDGTIYVFYLHSLDIFKGPSEIRFSKSSDGGSSWTLPATVAANLPTPGEFTLRNADPLFGSGAFAGFASNSFPTAAIAPDGTIFVAWVDFPSGSCIGDFSPTTCTNSDVRLSVSKDGGATWSAPVKITDESNATDQFFPWIAAHPDGLISIIWSDKRLDSANRNFDAFYTNTRDGKTFLRNVRVSSASSIIGTQFFIGDYNNLAVTDSGVFPAWNDLRFGADVDVFTAAGTLGR